MKPISYEPGTDVYTQNDEKLGSIDRIVIDPQTREVTHIVVREGILFTKDKVIPVPFLERSDDGHPKLRKEVVDVDALPNFEETHYVRAEDTGDGARIDPSNPNSMYWYPPLEYGAAMTYPPFFGDMPLLRPVVTERNIPDRTIALKKHAHVYDRNGKHIGSVSQIFTRQDTNEANYFVVEKGIFLKEDKLIPAWWVDVAREDEVRLAVSAEIFERLPDFEPVG